MERDEGTAHAAYSSERPIVIPFGTASGIANQGAADMVIESAVGYDSASSAKPALSKAVEQADSGQRFGGRVALVHLGNPGGLGTTRRVAVWRELLSGGGSEVIEINLLSEHRRRVPSLIAAAESLGGKVTPETAMWSVRSASRSLQRMDLNAVVFVTPRAFHPDLAIGRVTVLDLQDRFSRSYLGRAAVDQRLGATATWKALAWATGRFERRGRNVRTVTAGWSEAQEINATWIPNTVTAVDSDQIDDRRDASNDLVFFGKLTALPNLDALRRLASMWPELRAENPSLTLLVSGAAASPEVERLAREHDWRLQGSFDAVSSLCRQARIAIAPLKFATGIQNKVLEAAACGLPQVVSPASLSGTAPGFPALVASTTKEAALAYRSLLNRPDRRVDLAHVARDHVADLYSPSRWIPRAQELIMD